MTILILKFHNTQSAVFTADFLRQLANRYTQQVAGERNIKHENSKAFAMQLKPLKHKTRSNEAKQIPPNLFIGF
jgi:hypothetical protein